MKTKKNKDINTRAKTSAALKESANKNKQQPKQLIISFLIYQKENIAKKNRRMNQVANVYFWNVSVDCKTCQLIENLF